MKGSDNIRTQLVALLNTDNAFKPWKQAMVYRGRGMGYRPAKPGDAEYYQFYSYTGATVELQDNGVLYDPDGRGEQPSERMSYNDFLELVKSQL